MNKKEPMYIKATNQNLKNHSIPDENVLMNNRSVASTDPRLMAGFNKFDTDFHRPEDRIPTKHHDIIQLCQSVYKKNGFIRNIIDLMADFCSEGLDIRHPIKREERFYKRWSEQVDLQGRAHDFMKLLLRDANVIVRRKEATITKPITKEMTKAFYDFSIDNVDERKVNEKPEKINKKKEKIEKNIIPWGYTFISPVIVEKIGGPVGRFFGSSNIGMRITNELANSIKNPATDAEKEFISKLPKEVISAANKGSRIIALDPSKMYIDYYKKDDWEDWGTPFLYGIIEDLLLKDKMKQADRSALDGVINTIRLWKLGDSENKILPTPAAVNKLLNILQHNVGGGSKDIVWDDMIDLQVEYPPTDKILGSDKYKSVNSDIIKGLGIPDSLVGGTDLGTRNAQTGFIQLKTLVERLEYVRDKCAKWIQNELDIVAKAMGFKTSPFISFENMSLRDESAEKQLMIQLLDRGLISVETVHKVFGNNFVVELENIRLEQEIRDKEPKILEKANPYYRPLSVMEFQKQTQIELEELKNTENLSGDQPKQEQISGPGRPLNTRDINKRDIRTPKSLSFLKAKAEEFITDIDSIMDSLYLSKNNIKNIRSMTKKQKDELQNIKYLIISNIKYDDIITKELIINIVTNPSNKKINMFNKTLKELVNEYKLMNEKEISISVYKSLACSTWAILNLNGVK
jgi:hypothetical protein